MRRLRLQRLLHRERRETGFLIDIEKYTMQRFGTGDGIVEWTCLDCG